MITGEGNEDVRVGLIKVVPRYIHPPEEGRRWVVVRPTRLAVVTPAVVVNATIVSPAIRIPRGTRLVSTETTAALRIDDPNGEPFAALAVVENNRITQGIVEWALTTGFGQTGKGKAAVGRNRCPEMLMGLALTPRESL